MYDHKVSESRISLCWTGERLPFTSTADQTAEAQNRMAAIVVSKARMHIFVADEHLPAVFVYIRRHGLINF